MVRVVRNLRVRLESRAFKVVGGAALIGNVLFAIYLGLRAAPADDRLWVFWLGDSVVIIPTLACFLRAVLGGTRRAGAAWLGGAMLTFAFGSYIFVGWTQFQVNAPVPSAPDVFYLAFYPFVIVAVLCLLRRDKGISTKTLWLDGALGAAGAATAVSAVLSPALSPTGGALDAVVVSAAYSVGDLLLAAVVFGVLAVRGIRGGSMWLWLGAGLLTYCAGDVTYALRVAAGTYVPGGVCSALWAIGLTAVSYALWTPERSRAADSGRSTALLTIPILGTVIALVVLVVSSFSHLPAVVVALATLVQALAVLRTMVAFKQVRRLSDAHHQAVTDELTGLGNRRALFEQGAQRLADADASARIALLLIDLDDFKEVNDSLGHHAGDELLREIARRLTTRVRDPDLLVRLGGDEFAVIAGLRPDEDPLQSADRILDRIGLPFDYEGVRLRVKACAGVAECRGGASNVPELLRRADVALYAAKAAGARAEAYDPQLDEDNRLRLETIQDLDTAIVKGQFRLHYQPKINVSTGAIVGAEALVRWQHPTRGLIYPDAFLPLVQQCGLMGSVTRIVMRAAVAQIAEWRAAGLAMHVAVNLSASDLLEEHLAERILELLSEHAVPVEALELEITESVLMTDPERAREVLERLRGLGLRIAVDDYGTGYCALAYLHDLPIDELKIDRSFIASMVSRPRSVAIVRSTIELAHALDLVVVAEGVEEPEVLASLVSFGCDFAQGYHFSRPLTATAFAAWVRAAEPRPLAAVG